TSATATLETSATAAPETSATAAHEISATTAHETNSAPAGTHATTTSDTSVQQATTSSKPATNPTTEPPMVLDPKRCTIKGRNKRLRGPLVKKKKGKTAAPPTTDFGTMLILTLIKLHTCNTIHPIVLLHICP
ncbi:hypothetical protein SOVF_206680, partial [Spinacia oleracea]